MDLDEIERALTGQDITGTEALVALGLLSVGLLLYAVVGRLMRRAASRLPDGVVPGEAVEIGVRLAQLLVLGVFVAWALTVLGANVGWLTLLIVALLLIAAMAAKPFIDGLASSVVIANRSAFSVGDEIEVDGLVGRFERLAKRSTVIRTRDGVRVHVPNTELMDKTVKVYTAYDERRSAVEVTVSLDTDLDVADEVIRTALSDVAPIRRVGSIRAQGLGDGVRLSIRFWHGPAIVEGNDAVDGAVRALKVGFERAGIQLVPTSTIHIGAMPPAADRSGAADQPVEGSDGRSQVGVSRQPCGTIEGGTSCR